MDSDDAKSEAIPISIDSDAESSIYIPSEIGLYSKASRSVYENGRTYHGFREGEYWGPNDKRMLDHEELVHNMCLMSMRDKLYLAPIHNPHHILDIGTGKGLWAINMADKFPNAKVTGIDLSRVRNPDIPPANVDFFIDDATSYPWTWPEDHFDFIHIRGLFGSIADWPELYAHVLRHLKPGGWFEQMEWSTEVKSIDGSLAPDAVLARWSREATEASRLHGKTFKIAETMAGLIDEAGFVNRTERVNKWPIGPWCKDAKAKDFGYHNIRNWEQGMEGWVLALFTRLLGWSKADVDALLKEVKEALQDTKQHAYTDVHIVYAQKPM